MPRHAGTVQGTPMSEHKGRESLLSISPKNGKKEKKKHPIKSELNLCKPKGSGCRVQDCPGLGDPACFTGWVLCQ